MRYLSEKVTLGRDLNDAELPLIYKPQRKEADGYKDQPRCVPGRAKSHQVVSMEEESGKTEARPQIMTAVLGFGKEFGFDSKWDGKLLDGFKKKKKKKV